MNSRIARCVCALSLAATLSACSGSKPVTPVTPTPNPTAATIVINAPTPVSPANGATTVGWPTFTVTDATHTGPAGPLVYRFDIGTSADFSTITLTATVSETQGQTSFTPASTTAPPPQNALFWRVVAIDPFNVVASPASSAQSFQYTSAPTIASTIAAQEGVALWPGVQPTGNAGHALLGNAWSVGNLTSFDGITFLSPELQELQVFDLLDRGFAPQAAIDWMHGNGYSTVAAWYSDVAVIGFTHQYMAFVNGRWDLVLKAGA